MSRVIADGLSERATATTQEAEDAVEGKYPDGRGVHAAFNQYGLGYAMETASSSDRYEGDLMILQHRGCTMPHLLKVLQTHLRILVVMFLYTKLLPQILRVKNLLLLGEMLITLVNTQENCYQEVGVNGKKSSTPAMSANSSLPPKPLAFVPLPTKKRSGRKLHDLGKTVLNN